MKIELRLEKTEACHKRAVEKVESRYGRPESGFIHRAN